MPAKSLQVSHWLNTTSPISLEDVRGNIVMITVFQMLCPSCVLAGLPQAKKVQALFAQQDVIVLGLHSVFEHHEAMQEVSLRAFLHEFGITFPVAIDMPAMHGAQPQTMQNYQFQGTPTTILIDREGRLRLQYFGHIDDMMLGAEIASLLQEQSNQ